MSETRNAEIAPSGCTANDCLCCGRGHICEPDHYPTELGETWTCPGCGWRYEAYDAHAAHADTHWGRHVPEGTLGWHAPAPYRIPPAQPDEDGAR